MMNRYFVLLLAVGVLLQDATNAFAEGTGLARVECNKAAMFAAGSETARHYASEHDLEVLHSDRDYPALARVSELRQRPLSGRGRG